MTGRILALRKSRWDRQRQTVPRTPRGWEVGPPGFIGFGVEKAGTSWWYQLISRHPEVVTRGHPKELNYFSRFDTFGEEEASRYHLWFPRPSSAVTGEWTPDYIADDRTPGRAAASAPDALIIVLIRDPVERYRSSIAMRVGSDMTSDSLSMETLARVPDYIERDTRAKGHYPRQLEKLFASFPREQVLVLQYESCIRDIWTEIARTYRFLGLRESFRPLLARRRVHGSRPLRLADDLRGELIAHYEPEVAALGRSDIGLDLSLWPNFKDV
jgi:hypothetical protein